MGNNIVVGNKKNLQTDLVKKVNENDIVIFKQS